MSFKTPDLCDAFSDECQIVLGTPRFFDFGGKLSFNGPISTLKVFEDNTLVRQQLETDGKGRVMVVDAGGSNRCAMLGDNLAELGVKNNWAGIIMYGCIRDSEDIAQLALGVKALGTMPLKSVKRGEGQIDIPVTFAGVTFTPGDFAYCDADGIITAGRDLLTV